MLLTKTAVDKFYDMKIIFAPRSGRGMEFEMRLASRFFSMIVLHTFSAMGKRNNFSASCRTCLQLLLAWDKMALLFLLHIAALELDPTPGGIILSELFLVAVTVLDHCIESVPSILVQYCRTDTTREWLDTTRTTRTGRETMVYGLSRSWINGHMHIIVISITGLQPRRYDPYESYDSYGLVNNGLRVVQLVKCISLKKLTVYIQVHDSYDSWNNGSRIVHPNWWTA